MFTQLHHRIETGVCTSNYLFGGKLGLALYYFSCYEARGDESLADRCIDLLQEVLNGDDETMAPLHGTGFASGTAGLGYLLTVLLKEGLIGEDIFESIQEMDVSIANKAMEQLMVEEHTDYLHGAMGALQYFLHRNDEPFIHQYTEAITAVLATRVKQNETGTWFRNFILDKNEKERIDLSLSHGNTGFLLLLLQLWEAGIMKNELTAIITSGIQFILAHPLRVEQVAEYGSLYPFFINEKDSGHVYANPRLAWCYGDLNIAWILYRAADALQMPEWKTEADRILAHSLTRTDSHSTLISDSHFCHGSSGLAHFYRIIAGFTGNPACIEAADHWLEQTSRYLEKELTSQYYQGKETDLLNGLPGIALVYLSAITKKDLAWSRAFLL
ncbi:MAG: hypothetical protein NTW29_10480 [Bacteroidetes bacterium]|nr:hypothetical protein [Bacteroidota bacterium]